MKKIFVGEVVSDKMTKTVVVAIKRDKKNLLYKKAVRREKKLYAENLKGAKQGDLVKIEECKPLSSLKRFVVLEVMTRKDKE